MANINPSDAEWVTVLTVYPVTNLDDMEASDEKHPVILWRMVSGGEWEVKATEILFQRFHGSSKFRFMVKGFLRVDDTINQHQEHFPVGLTKRVRWMDPKCTTLRGTKSKSRLVEVVFSYDEESNPQANDVVRVEVIVPKTSDSDKGKPLHKALNWARSLVQTQLDLEDFKSSV
ncbi:hypothetical protein SEMRO_613_G175630.1 [Seminavis robusta]|uniref:Uncharacterized protein n=1 Tax=Seminavis robusta TaxID=568900 RepID=A0A9N8E3G5_9STRA|nr:hypothetical protein SEMRO_613_G175630.1 [Seminavis robusta]|eukprot:Sro613_g175630.1 n/a (174) ;mRNA; f:37535-38056